MFEAVLAIIGLIFAFWGMSSVDRREAIRTLVATNGHSLRVVAYATVIWVLGVPIAIAWLATCESFAPYADLAGGCAVAVLALLAWAGWQFLRPAPWTADRIGVLETRIDYLMRSGQASAVAQLVADIASELRTTEDFVARRADQLLARCCLFPEFARVFVNEQTASCAKILRMEDRAIFKFSDQILEAAMELPSGVLSQELAQCQNFLPGRAGYQIPASCHLLHAYFDDARVADRVHAWAPVGDYVLRHLSQRRISAASIRENEVVPGRYEERERWRSLEGTAVWYFRIMLTEAMRQGVPWHMWLFYLPRFVEAMLPLSRVEKGDERAEYPDQYLYLVADCLRLLGELAEMAAKLDPANPHGRAVEPNAENQNDSIPKSSVIALGDCLRTILMDQGVPSRFKQDQIEFVADLYGRLDEFNAASKLPHVLAAVLNATWNVRYRPQVVQELRRLATYSPHHAQYKGLLVAMGEPVQ